MIVKYAMGTGWGETSIEVIYFDQSIKMSGYSMMIAPTNAMKQNSKILHEQ